MINDRVKKVLMIAFIYPPLGGSGVQRSLKFSKFLPEFGWQPFVVCGDDSQSIADGLDPSLLEEIPSVVKVWCRPYVHPMGIRKRVYRFLRITPRDAPPETANNNPLNEINTASTLSLQRLIRRLFQVLGKLLSPIEIPPIDSAIYWALAILPGCLKLIRNEQIDLIYSSSFPFSDHVAAWLLKKITGLPWVADFRDLWTQDELHQVTGWRHKIDLFVERQILNSANTVINVTPTSTREAHNIVSARSLAEFITIENGFDEQDFLNVVIEKEEAKVISFAHVGKLYNHTAIPFFEAFEKLGDVCKNVRIKFIGGLSSDVSNWLINHSIFASIECLPRQPHKKAVEMMCSADILLIFLGADRAWESKYPGKLFEYMASGVPILLIGTPGDSSDLILQSGTGCHVQSGDVEDLTQTLKIIVKNYDVFRLRYYQPKEEIINSYERRKLTEKLASEFNRLAQKE